MKEVSQVIWIHDWYLYHPINENSEQRKSSNTLIDLDWSFDMMIEIITELTLSVDTKNDTDGEGLWLTTQAIPWSSLYMYIYIYIYIYIWTYIYIYMNINVDTIRVLRYGGVYNNSINDNNLMNKW